MCIVSFKPRNTPSFYSKEMGAWGGWIDLPLNFTQGHNLISGFSTQDSNPMLLANSLYKRQIQFLLLLSAHSASLGALNLGVLRITSRYISQAWFSSWITGRQTNDSLAGSVPISGLPVDFHLGAPRTLPLPRIVGPLVQSCSSTSEERHSVIFGGSLQTTSGQFIPAFLTQSRNGHCGFPCCLRE